MERVSPEAFADVDLAELRGRWSYKWRRYPADVLPAFVAEMDFAIAEPIRGALAAAVERGDTGYAWPAAELTEALGRFAAARFGWEVAPGDVSLLPDVMAGVTELLRVAVPPGSGVVINTPVYPPFYGHIEEAGCRPVPAPLARDGAGYALDLDAVEAAFAGGARVYLLCNPHNPTGLVLSCDELVRVAELAERHSVLVLSDEIHSPLVLPAAVHVPYLSTGEAARRHGVALVAASKGWNVPGLKCAQLVAQSEPMRELAGRLREDVPFRAGLFGVIAAASAYAGGVPWLDAVCAAIDGKRRLMGELVEEMLPGVRYEPPRGTYLAWLDCSGLDLPGEPVDVFLERGRVALGAGLDFGPEGRGFVRVTLATGDNVLREIADRMRSALG